MLDMENWFKAFGQIQSVPFRMLKINFRCNPSTHHQVDDNIYMQKWSKIIIIRHYYYYIFYMSFSLCEWNEIQDN
jgi:hypothetical protein